MAVSAAALKMMRDFGMTADQMVLLAEELEAGTNSRPDTAADRRRSWDRERKRQQRQSGGNQVDSPPDTTSVSPSPRPSSTSEEPTPFSPLKGTVSPSRHGQADGEPDGFAEFWAAYPRKVGKGAARRAWEPPRRKIGRSFPGLAMAALARVAPTWTDPQFIPHPATWLHQERWDDEVGDSAPAAVNVAEWTDEKWTAALNLHRSEGWWSDDIGPKPGEPGCKVPARLLLESAA